MTYTLYRRSSRADLYCAVPQGKPAPFFISEPEWELVGTTAPDRPRPLGFNEDVARFASAAQGYYAFGEHYGVEWLRRPATSGETSKAGA